MLVPYNSKELSFANDASTSAAASPFVVAMVESGIHTLPGFLNGCILLFVVSAANSDVYISSRTLYSLAIEGEAPAIFARTSRRGVPIYALAVSGTFACLAFMNATEDSKAVFNYLVNVVTVFGLLTWLTILVSHIYFVRARKAQGLLTQQLPYSAPMGVLGSYIALFLCIVFTIVKNFDVFIYDPDRSDYPKLDYRDFISGYIGIPVYLILLLGYKFGKKTKTLTPLQVDLYSGQTELDREQQELVERSATEKGVSQAALYRRCIAWLF
ncbi:MAG: hypothetical protein M1822_002439 [Bathelium mastoideum]|nr:MAG: hypothetical protein M1822_002439 [Bathelium mastoideum]